MRIELNKNGTLYVTPEDDVEVYALKKWKKDNLKNSDIKNFYVNTDVNEKAL